MADVASTEQDLLEARTIAAHRAYLLALLAWERVLHRMNCSICRPAGLIEEERLQACRAAEAEKESRRIVFRDLCDELGYIPAGHDIALPAENTSDCCEAGSSH